MLKETLSTASTAEAADLQPPSTWLIIRMLKETLSTAYTAEAADL